MDKTALIVLCLLMLLLLGGCRAETPTEPHPDTGTSVCFINEGKEADVWILPETEKNMKTTVWGTATAAKVQPGEHRRVPLCEPGSSGRYLLRMIDTDSFYYSANGIALADGWTLTLKEDEAHAVTAEVTDETGALQSIYEVFAAKL